MWFLIKGTFWFAAVLVVLSYFSGRPVTEPQGASALEVGDAFAAATEAYQYVSAICAEKPDVCEKGAETFSALGVRAKEGARVAFELLDKQFGNGQTNGQANGQSRETAKETEASLVADPDPTPFPAATAAPADAISTGTVPVPQKRPAH
ncbi:DUF5330 domain-containing protein [Neorhizobium petrolearium]|uniref:DUF5330 domain-containing protein n=1 Tax=Neorhizobium petrolearium TaxID=515361 RepID=UPI003F136EFA